MRQRRVCNPASAAKTAAKRRKCARSLSQCTETSFPRGFLVYFRAKSPFYLISREFSAFSRAYRKKTHRRKTVSERSDAGSLRGTPLNGKRPWIMACWAKTQKGPPIMADLLPEWSQQGMILRLPDYESGALTN